MSPLWRVTVVNVTRVISCAAFTCVSLWLQFMGHMDVISFISDGFNIYFPIAIVLLCILTWFSVGQRVLHLVGFQQFIGDDNMTQELIDEGTQLVTRGNVTVSQVHFPTLFYLYHIKNGHYMFLSVHHVPIQESQTESHWSSYLVKSFLFLVIDIAKLFFCREAVIINSLWLCCFQLMYSTLTATWCTSWLTKELSLSLFHKLISNHLCDIYDNQSVDSCLITFL